MAGQVAKKKQVPDHYDQNIQLDTDFDGVHLATGKWTAKGFYLFKGSRIMQEYLGQNNAGINIILNELIKDNVVIEEFPYYILTEDIILHSASTAACLVHGNSRTGFRDWKSNGKTLSELIVP
jgi:hypothetical protein